MSPQRGAASGEPGGGGRPWVSVAASVLVGLCISGGMVWRGTAAAFTGTTSNAPNSWTTGSVVLTDNDSAGALFSTTGMVPASTDTRCITVTYAGTVASPIKLSAVNPTDTGLAADITLTIDVATADAVDASMFGTSAGCASLPATTLFTGTLASFTSTRTDHVTGLGTTWTPSGNPTHRVFRFTWTLSPASQAPGTSAGATFTWEGQAGI